MKAQELYDHITKHITPEEALLKLLESSLLNYDKLKFANPDEAIHPILLITFATMDLGWDFAVEKERPGQKDVRGMIVGTEEYINEVMDKFAKAELFDKK